jgi:hypothetical protein
MRCWPSSQCQKMWGKLYQRTDLIHFHPEGVIIFISCDSFNQQATDTLIRVYRLTLDIVCLGMIIIRA